MKADVQEILRILKERHPEWKAFYEDFIDCICVPFKSYQLVYGTANDTWGASVYAIVGNTVEGWEPKGMDGYIDTPVLSTTDDATLIAEAIILTAERHITRYPQFH